MERIIKNIGIQIRILRKSKNISQEELSNIANLHPTYIGQVERGEKNLTISSLLSITNALDISLEKFFSLIESNTPSTLDKENEILPYQKILYLLQDLNFKEQEALHKLIADLIRWKQL